MFYFFNRTLRTVVIIPFTMVLLITIILVTLIQKNSYEHHLEDISQKQLNSIAKRIDAGLTSFLSDPFKVNNILSKTITINQQDNFAKNKTLDIKKIERNLRQNFQYISPNIEQLDSIAFGGVDGQYVGFRKNEDSTTSLILKTQASQNKLTIFDGVSSAAPMITQLEKFDPRNRIWYTTGMSKKESSWTSLYKNKDEFGDSNMSATAPIYIQDTLVGVLAADVRLKTFQQFLNEQQKETDARVVIFDENKNIIAQSDADAKTNASSEKIQEKEPSNPTSILDIKDPILHQLVEHFISNNLNTDEPQDFSFEYKGSLYFNYVYKYQYTQDLNWTIAVTLPEFEISDDFNKNQNNAVALITLISLLAGLGIFIFLTRITKPLRETSKAAHKIAQGDWNATMPEPGNIQEVNSMVNSFNDMATTLKRSFETLREQITYDSLTRLYTRQGFIDAVESSRLHNDAHGSFLLCSAERFRDINDTLGHFRSDKVLIIMAERLKSILDSQHIIARMNSDEFAIYVPFPSRSIQMNMLLDKIQKKFNSPIKVGSEEVLIHIVIGISSTQYEGGLNQWLHNTSIALSHAKSDPRYLIHYTPEMANDSYKRTQTIVRINRALKCNEFVPFYQPLVDLNTGEIIGAEALARWISPERGLIPPLEFISIAEEYGQISYIGEQILQQACCDTQNQIDAGLWPADFHMHVNISVHQLSMPSFDQTVADILEKTRLSPKNLTLEITESHIVDNDPVLIENTQRLRKLGVSIAIDDFGTGYSSLAYLHKLPFDCLKIDRCFVTDLTEENLQTSVIASILQMTSALNIEIVAEGIETKYQAELLKKLNCQQAQGFYYAKPVPLEQWPNTNKLPEMKS